MNRWCIPACLALYGFVVVPHVHGGSWTNQAGHAIHAELIGYEDGAVSLRTTNGATLRMPIDALCAEDQKRIRERYNATAVPAFVLAAYRDARAVLTRYDRLPEKHKSLEARRKAVVMALAVFDRRVPKQSFAVLDEDAQADTVRLRRSLK